MAYDTSTANPVNPQGTVGGGNVQNISPLFGSNYAAGSSTGSNGATTTNKDTAALGGGATSADVPVAPSTATGTAASITNGLTAFWAANKTIILMVTGLLGLLFAIGYAVKTLRK